MVRFSYALFLSALLCAILQYVLAVVLPYLHLNLATIRLLPLVFVGCAIGAVVSASVPERFVKAIYLSPFGGVTLLVSAFLFFNNEFALSIVIPLAFAACYSPLVYLLFRGTFTQAYTYDLYGTLLGFVIAMCALGFFGAEWLLLLCMMLAISIGLISITKSHAAWWLFVGSVLGVLLLQYSAHFFDLMQAVSTFPGKLKNDVTHEVLSEENRSEYRMLGSQWSTLSRVDIAQNVMTGSVVLFYDRMRWSTFSTSSTSLFYHTLPALSPSVRTALIIGTGSGRDVHALTTVGVRTITALEVNDATYRMLTGPHAEYANNIYNLLPVIRAEGRAYLEAHPQALYDLIVLPRPDLSVTQASSLVTLDAYLYTSEAMDLYWKKLSPDGVLWISRGALRKDPNHLSIALSKNADTIRDFVERSGIDPKTQLFAFTEVSPDTGTKGLRQKKEVRRMMHFILLKKPLSGTHIHEVTKKIKESALDPHLVSTNFSESPRGLWPSEVCLQDILESVSTCNVQRGTLTDNRPFLWVNPTRSFLTSYLTQPGNISFIVITLSVLMLCIFLPRGAAKRYLFISFITGCMYGTFVAFFYYAFIFIHSSPLFISVMVQSAMLMGSILGLRFAYSTRRTHVRNIASALVIALTVGLLITHTEWFFIPLENARLALGLLLVICATTGVTSVFPSLIPRLREDSSNRGMYILAANHLGIGCGVFLSILVSLLFGMTALTLSIVSTILILLFSIKYLQQ
ncbi:hypothetical protein EBR66_05685 [bacterium]|nr:hypothetical protein [bacterium]